MADAFYLFHEGLGKVLSKWEYREDAKDELQEMKESGLKGMKVLTPAGVRRKVGKIVYATDKDMQSLFTRRNPSSSTFALRVEYAVPLPHRRESREEKAARKRTMNVVAGIIEGAGATSVQVYPSSVEAFFPTLGQLYDALSVLEQPNPGKKWRVVDAIELLPGGMTRDVPRTRHNPRKEVYGLYDFQRQANVIDQALGAAYRDAMTLKGMFDTFEQIPSKQYPLYKATMKIMDEIREARQRAYQLTMDFMRYR